jgi:hypothetical protein
LLIYRTAGLSPRPSDARSVEVQETTDATEALDWLANSVPEHGGSLGPSVLDEASAMRADRPILDHALSKPGHGLGSTCLRAGRAGRVSGFAEFITVQTLLYSGLWIESLAAPELATRRALTEYVLEKAKMSGLDEVGAMVPEDNWSLQQDLLAEGFRSLGDFRWYTADLPLKGPGGIEAGPPVHMGRISKDGA